MTRKITQCRVETPRRVVGALVGQPITLEVKGVSEVVYDCRRKKICKVHRIIYEKPPPSMIRNMIQWLNKSFIKNQHFLSQMG